MSKQERVTGAKPTECRTCEGIGYTQATATEMRRNADGVLWTKHRGSGCPDCYGTGQKNEA